MLHQQGFSMVLTILNDTNQDLYKFPHNTNTVKGPFHRVYTLPQPVLCLKQMDIHLTTIPKPFCMDFLSSTEKITVSS